MSPALTQQILELGLLSEGVLHTMQSQHAADDTALVVELSKALGDRADWLSERIAEMSGLLLFDLEAGEINPEARQLLPLDIARASCAVATTLRGDRHEGTAQVVMANPMDEQARQRILSVLEVHVEFGVAKPASIFKALETAEVQESPDLQPLAADKTGKYNGDSIVPGARSHDGTVPAQRLDALATPQQRIEALVLTLVSEGVIERSKYEATLERCLRQANLDDGDLV